MSAQRKFAIETGYIRAFVGAGYSITVCIPVSESMRAQGFCLPDVHYLIRTGRVTHSDMLEMRGLWTMSGRNVDGIHMRVTFLVEAEEYDVELIKVVRVERGGME